jgi:hypothetical protein
VGGGEGVSPTPQMSRALLRTAALIATRAAQSAARCDAAKSCRPKDMVESMCPPNHVDARRAFDSEHDAREGEHCSRVCVPPFSSFERRADCNQGTGRGVAGSALDCATRDSASP